VSEWVRRLPSNITPRINNVRVVHSNSKMTEHLVVVGGER
jgi:hypothetical protein